MNAPARRWTGKSRGPLWGHLFFYYATRVTGLWFAYFSLFFPVAYYVLTMHDARQASFHYLDRVLGKAPWWKRWARTYWHFFQYSRTALDALVLGARGTGAFSLIHDGIENLRDAARTGNGVIFLTAHVGSWTVAARLIDELTGAKFAVTALEADEAKMQEFFRNAHGEAPRVISIGADPLSSIELIHALRDGYAVALQGDRSVGPRVVRVPFLGSMAEFPAGPFLIASLARVPIVVTFAAQSGWRKYHFTGFPPFDVKLDRSFPMEPQLEEAVKKYVARLEDAVRKHPYQFFNFFEFWPEDVKAG